MHGLQAEAEVGFGVDAHLGQAQSDVVTVDAAGEGQLQAVIKPASSSQANSVRSTFKTRSMPVKVACDRLARRISSLTAETPFETAGEATVKAPEPKETPLPPRASPPPVHAIRRSNTHPAIPAMDPISRIRARSPGWSASAIPTPVGLRQIERISGLLQQLAERSI